jgi:hypothetical protein
MKDVDRIRIRKVYACFPGWHSGGSSAPISHKHILSHPSFSSPLINEDLPAGPQLVFTLNSQFFRHQACYSLLSAKPGGQADRVVSLSKYKVVGCYPQNREYIYWRLPPSYVHSFIVVNSPQLAEGESSPTMNECTQELELRRPLHTFP